MPLLYTQETLYGRALQTRTVELRLPLANRARQVRDAVPGARRAKAAARGRHRACAAAVSSTYVTHGGHQRRPRGVYACRRLMPEGGSCHGGRTPFPNTDSLALDDKARYHETVSW
jgi:hypothetical protein